MSKTIHDYIVKNNTYFQPEYTYRYNMNKACYTGCLLHVEKTFNALRYKDKIITEILKTHKKINKLIESFNKDTNYKYKEIFENRNNYCDNYNCNICSNLFLSCINYDKYIKFKMNISDVEKFSNIIGDIYNELVKIIKLEI